MEPSERVPGAFVIAVGSVALCGVVMSSHCVQKAFKMVHVGLIHALPSWPAHPQERARPRLSEIHSPPQRGQSPANILQRFAIVTRG
jgi:hypothetical protein